jgi:hypothetical protein
MKKISTCQILLLLILFVNSLNVLSCGKRGPSLPPIKVLPAKADDLKVRQIDDSVILSFMIPEKNTDGSPIQEALSVSVICHMEQVQEESPSSPSYDEFLKRARICMKIDTELILQKKIGRRAFVEDNIFERYGVKAWGKRFSYAVQLKNEKGKVSALSNISSLISGKPLSAPTYLQARVLEDGIQLSWKSPLSETAEKEEQLFNIYRIESHSSERSVDRVADGEEKASTDLSEEKGIELLLDPINKRPVLEMTYFDGFSQFGKHYLYSVRTLYDDEGLFRESGNSNIITVQPLDVFPPESPQGLIAVAEGPVIRLFWYPNTEKDLGGYRIYRAPERSGSFLFIAETPPHMTSYTDREVLPEKTWHYYLTAFDRSEPANESPASPIISEVALPSFDRQGLNEDREHE